MSTQDTFETFTKDNCNIAKRGRGRPRPDYTVDRDREILSFLTRRGSEGWYDWTVKDLALEFRLQEKEVYASLLRLSWGNGTKTKPGIPYVYKTSRVTYRSMIYKGISTESIEADTESQNGERHIMEDITEEDTTTAKWM